MGNGPPLIGINGLFERGRGSAGSAPKIVLGARYADAVRRAGGLPLVIAPGVDVDELLERVDGVVLSGGDDFDMERLGLGATHAQATPTPAEKQDFDVALARACLARGVPTLGICYGMQTLGLCEGATLLQHLPEDRPDCGEHAGGVVHPVRIRRDSKLAAAVGVGSLEVVSRHHQALGSVAAAWTVAATDENGLIEAIERANHPFALGVQWHPELSAADSPHARLFAALIAAARERPAARIGAQPEATTW
jgi:putative glutamine amidotransferase